MSAIPTVKIKSENPDSQGDFIVINESDFDSKTMTLFDAPKKAAKKKAAK